MYKGVRNAQDAPVPLALSSCRDSGSCRDVRPGQTVTMCAICPPGTCLRQTGTASAPSPWPALPSLLPSGPPARYQPAASLSGYEPDQVDALLGIRLPELQEVPQPLYANLWSVFSQPPQGSETRSEYSYLQEGYVPYAQVSSRP